MIWEQQCKVILMLTQWDEEKLVSRNNSSLVGRTWAAHGVPEDVNVMLQYLLEARRYVNNNTGPVVVHCSSGTGRTGIVLALDICMREFEECRTVDILRCVSRLRQDRGGAVQTKEQYFFLYEVCVVYRTGTWSKQFEGHSEMELF
ncbi:tyrosine-protein phosphatase non-receptor type 20-like [Tachypleus tridentatus]|uniref:tyrosine-protein phosphatase non-receptor type 20-like n=1 Tax=Tachypleus tridentatus TaxID=6853 RepID=UPI003FD41FB6